MTRLFELLEQLAIDIAFTRLVRDQVPKVANFSLADAMNAPKSLLDAIRIPRQVIIHHQMRTLEVDAFAGGVGGQQNLHRRVMPERFLRLKAVLTAHRP